MAIAALPHDAVEDEGGLPRLRDVEANFGKEVAIIVDGCTDSFEEDSNKKQEWELRKSYRIKVQHDFLELGFVFAALMRSQIGLAAHVHGIQAARSSS
jgi:hypothetical protein